MILIAVNPDPSHPKGMHLNLSTYKNIYQLSYQILNCSHNNNNLLCPFLTNQHLAATTCSNINSLLLLEDIILNIYVKFTQNDDGERYFFKLIS